MLILRLILTQGTHGVIDTQCVFGCSAENDVLSLDVTYFYRFILSMEGTFRFSVLSFVLYPYFFRLRINFSRLQLFYCRVNGSRVVTPMVHRISKDLIAHQPLAHLSHAVILAGGEDDRVLLHGWTEEASAASLRRYYVCSEANEQRVPGCSVNHFTYQLPVSHYVGQRYLVHGIDAEIFIQHLGVEVLSEAVLRNSLNRCDFAPQGCKLLGVKVSFWHKRERLYRLRSDCAIVHFCKEHRPFGSRLLVVAIHPHDEVMAQTQQTGSVHRQFAHGSIKL